MTLAFSKDDLAEATKLLQDLVRIDTTNPPGNEGKASEFLKSVFDKERIECEVVGPKERESFIARLPGKTGKPRLLLLSHTDVVPVTDPSRWKYPPFSGTIEGEWLYGRGSCDDKFDAAVEAMAMILLKRLGVKLNGTLIYAATADEEAGAQYGCGWLIKSVPDRVKAEYVLNEGGGNPVKLGGKIFYMIGFGEKGVCGFKLKAKGKAGHGSIPTLADNANLKMAEAFIKLSRFRPDIVILPEVKEALIEYGRALMGDQGERIVREMATPEKIDTLLGQVASMEREMAETARALTRMTISPNVIRGGNKVNVIPDICEAEVDTRVLPGQDEKYAVNVIQKAIEGTGVEIESTRYKASSASPMKTPFIDTLSQILKRHAGEVTIVSQLNTGMTDSLFFRQLGAEAYGFIPTAPTQDFKEILPGVHGNNEKIDIPSIEFATKYLLDVTQEVLK
jgi:acetylornithine deacetylase/succinyl-diaminopimelate desuccinylase-like protein